MRRSASTPAEHPRTAGVLMLVGLLGLFSLGWAAAFWLARPAPPPGDAGRRRSMRTRLGQ